LMNIIVVEFQMDAQFKLLIVQIVNLSRTLNDCIYP
jgi:hypothetical protein